MKKFLLSLGYLFLIILGLILTIAGVGAFFSAETGVELIRGSLVWAYGVYLLVKNFYSMKNLVNADKAHYKPGERYTVKFYMRDGNLTLSCEMENVDSMIQEVRSWKEYIVIPSNDKSPDMVFKRKDVTAMEITRVNNESVRKS